MYVILRIYHTHLDNEEETFLFKSEMLPGKMELADSPALGWRRQGIRSENMQLPSKFEAILGYLVLCL